MDELLEKIETLILQNKVLQHQLDAERHRVEFMVRQLTHIHALLYPPTVKMDDGRVMQFHSPMQAEQIQALSDAIRAIPEKLRGEER